MFTCNAKFPLQMIVYFYTTIQSEVEARNRARMGEEETTKGRKRNKGTEKIIQSVVGGVVSINISFVSNTCANMDKQDSYH